jgi:outer membrane protein
MKKPGVVVVLAMLVAAPAAEAQQAPRALSLTDALTLAWEHNPEYLSQLNDRGVADWGVRAAYGAFLPSATVGGGLSYQGGGQARIGGFTSGDIGLGDPPSYYYSSYTLGLNLGLDGSTFYRVGQERALREGVLARMDAAGHGLRAAVTRQYLSALRQRDAVALARAELERADLNLSLARARHSVEAATVLEVGQAEVERGRAEVELLRAEVGLETETLRLFQLMGLEAEPVELTTQVEVFEPRWDAELLVGLASGAQPDLEVARATQAAARAEVGMARSAFLPRLSLSAGLSGFTRRASSDNYLLDQAELAVRRQREQCVGMNDLMSRLNPPLPSEDCSKLQFTDEMRAEILGGNRLFPFNFHREPVSVTLGVSVPVFQGLSRQRQLEAAHASAEDARHRLRAEELRIRTDVMASHRRLRAAYEAVRLEERNRELADAQLRLARERYRVGAAAFLELMEAETLKARADRAHLLGVYEFQEALTTLEAAVGHELVDPRD